LNDARLQFIPEMSDMHNAIDSDAKDLLDSIQRYSALIGALCTSLGLIAIEETIVINTVGHLFTPLQKQNPILKPKGLNQNDNSTTCCAKAAVAVNQQSRKPCQNPKSESERPSGKDSKAKHNP